MYSSEQLDQILNEKCTWPFRKGYVNIEGYTFPEHFSDLQEKIYNFSVYDDDTWICSFPRCGNTWTQEMVWLIANDLDFKGAEIELQKRVPFFEMSVYFDPRVLLAMKKDVNIADYNLNSLELVEKLKRPRFIKTHIPFELLPREIQEGTKKPKIIYVTRDPKDSCVSYFHLSRFLSQYRTDFSEFCELYLAGKVPFGPSWKHILSFKKREKSENIYFVKYEEMKKDLNDVIIRVALFLGKEISNDQIMCLADHLSFENMRKNPAVNYKEEYSRRPKLFLKSEEFEFLRSGEMGSHKSIMSQKMIDRFDEITLKEFQEVPELLDN